MTRSIIGLMQALVGNPEGVANLFAPDVQLFGSLTHKPFEGREAVLVIFGMLAAVCQDVRYVKEYTADDGVTLLVHGRIGDRQFDGIQVLTFNSDGLVTSFRDFVRPMSALQALQTAAGEYLARPTG
ncbi:MAG: nuclear transport factor 2 family protein [Candidatus Dormiibacterota bacterium]